MKKIFIVVAMVVLMMTSVSAQANLVSNGGFETLGADIGNTLYAVPAWTVADLSNGTGIYTGGSGPQFGLAPHGGVAFLWGGAFSDNIGSVSQTLTTTVGQKYNLDFWLQNGGGNPNSFSVNWNGTPLMSMSNAAGPSVMTNYASIVTGTGSDTLKFAFNNEPTAWALDNVNVNAVPIPAAIWLFGAGLVGLVGVRRRFKA